MSPLALESRQDAAVLLLQNRRIDAYVDDTAALAWILTENEASVGFLREPLDEDNLAWAVRRGDEQLLAAVNAVLEKWKADGTLTTVLYRWMPFLEQLH
jgi:polar amino acid transport system substrate-binding protein